MRNTKSRYKIQNTKYSWGRVQGEKEMEGTGKDEEEGPCDTGALWTVQLNQWNIFPQTIQLKFKTSCSWWPWLWIDNSTKQGEQNASEDQGHLCWKSRPAILCKCRVCILAFLLSIVFNKYTNSEKRLQTHTITMGMYYKYRWGGGAGRQAHDAGAWSRRKPKTKQRAGATLACYTFPIFLSHLWDVRYRRNTQQYKPLYSAQMCCLFSELEIFI